MESSVQMLRNYFVSILNSFLFIQGKWNANETGTFLSATANLTKPVLCWFSFLYVGSFFLY